MMRRSFTLTIATLALVTALPAQAAEPGTYRPGQVYSSSPVFDAELCESQCRGDAQCRAWNFVKVSPRQTSGVCELNSNDTAPIASRVSISGVSQSTPALSSSRLIPGGTNTVRVGQPSQTAPATRAIPPAQVRNAQRPVNRPSNRRVVRKAVPQHVQTRQSAYRSPHQSLTQQQLAQRQNPAIQGQRPAAPNIQHQQRRQAPRGLQHSLGALPQNAARPPIANPQQTAPQNYPQQRFQQRPQARAPQNGRPQAPNARAYNQADPRLQHLQNQQNAQRALQHAQFQPPRGRAPVAAPPPPRPTAPTASAPTAAPAPNFQASKPPMVRLPAARAQESLFGSLYDDVKAPKSISPEDINRSPDAPIATVKAVPTIPVQTETLSGLAGAAPQR